MSPLGHFGPRKMLAWRKSALPHTALVSSFFHVCPPALDTPPPRLFPTLHLVSQTVPFFYTYVLVLLPFLSLLIYLPVLLCEQGGQEKDDEDNRRLHVEFSHMLLQYYSSHRCNFTRIFHYMVPVCLSSWTAGFMRAGFRSISLLLDPRVHTVLPRW